MLTSMKVLTVLSLLSAAAVSAQSVLNVATGAEGGTYATMLKNMGQVYENTSFLKQLHTTGSIENLDDLLGNQASLAFVQLDVLKARAQIDHDPRTTQIRTLVALHREELHLIAQHQKRIGGVLGLGSALTGPVRYQDLKGQVGGCLGRQRDHGAGAFGAERCDLHHGDV